MKKLMFAVVLLFCNMAYAGEPQATLATDDLQEVVVVGEAGVELMTPYQYQRPINPYVRPGMSYRAYKNMYDVGDYDRDLDGRYSPFWSGFASFCITGLGQTCCGQFWRGLGFWAGKWALVGLFSENALLSTASYVGMSVWSIVDAARVAKIKSMYYSDMKRGYRSDISVELYPSLNCAPSVQGLTTTPSMTLSVSF